MTTLDLNDFDLSTQKDVGGNSGSIQVKLGEYLFQLKSSASKKPSEIVSSKGTDRKNYAEFIVARIAKKIVQSMEIDIDIPEISFVMDSKNPQDYPQIASQYITGQLVRNLDDYARENDSHILKGQHVRIVAGQKIYHRDLDINQTPIKKKLAFGLALSMIFGDHDINPGNMLIITDNGSTKVARIDFGHGLQSLLRGLSKFGAGITPGRNTILDFINRKKIAGINNKTQQNKLWRDYPGMVFSTELADALAYFSEVDPRLIDSAVDEAKMELKQLYKSSAKKTHIIKSLAQLYKNLDRENYRNIKKMINKAEHHDFIIDVLFNRISQFLKKNCEDAKIVSERLHLQLAIENNIELDPNDIKKVLREQFSSAILDEENTIEWVRTSEHDDAFHGTLEEYISHRKKIFANKIQNNEKNQSQNIQIIEYRYSSLFNKMNSQASIINQSNNMEKIIRNIGKFLQKQQDNISVNGQTILKNTQILLRNAQFSEALRNLNSFQEKLKNSSRLNGTREKGTTCMKTYIDGLHLQISTYLKNNTSISQIDLIDTNAQDLFIEGNSKTI